MSETQFTQQHAAYWQSLEQALKNPRQADFRLNEAAYRKLGQHFSLARQRHYSPLLVEYLQKLMLELHWHIQSPRSSWLKPFLQFLAQGFARGLRRQWRWLALSALLFYGSLFGTGIWLSLYPDQVWLVLDSNARQHLAEISQPSDSETVGRRDASTDIQMFGFYIRNNTGIGFRTFASGLLFGIGSVLIVLFNGLYIGAAGAYVLQLGYGPQFLPFVAGHSAFELSAVVICGAAGMSLGYRLLDPGHFTRAQALARNAREQIPLVMGAALLFLLAAFIEAFWSSQQIIPSSVRYAVGLLLWLLVGLYVWRAGRQA